MNEFIEKLIGRLGCARSIDNTPIDNIWNNAVNECVSRVNQLAEEYNNGWIPCSERLPEVEADVLLSLRSLDVYTGFRANTEGCFYVEGEGYVEFENVLAWKPLPAPYEMQL